MWCILIPLVVGIISAILGYLLGRLLGNKNNNDIDVNVFKNRIAILESDLEDCRTNKGSNNDAGHSGIASGAGNGGIGSTMMASNLAEATTTSAVVFDAEAAKAAYGKRIKDNDLTIIEGIGPKIQELFHNHDVKTWADLAVCSVEKCQSVLDSGGERFKIHKPGTWPKQSQLASEGKWKELKDWQDQLDGGK